MRRRIHQLNALLTLLSHAENWHCSLFHPASLISCLAGTRKCVFHCAGVGAAHRRHTALTATVFGAITQVQTALHSRTRKFLRPGLLVFCLLVLVLVLLDGVTPSRVSPRCGLPLPLHPHIDSTGTKATYTVRSLFENFPSCFFEFSRHYGRND